jgi:hypothetical protein
VKIKTQENKKTWRDSNRQIFWITACPS